MAAPTASLHFTQEVFESLKEKDITWTDIELKVGRGTFLPIKADKITDHKMHSEEFEITDQSALELTKAIDENRKIIPIGTTSMRVLEFWGLYGKNKSFRGDCDLFIYPGFDFKVCDGIITNFHQGNSTLICLVAAFMGLDNIKSIYKI